jgi:hypothetical protein
MLFHELYHTQLISALYSRVGKKEMAQGCARWRRRIMGMAQKSVIAWRRVGKEVCGGLPVSGRGTSAPAAADLLG